MKIGDIVCRKKYHQDISFEIIDIKDNIYYLRGIEYRLIADNEKVSRVWYPCLWILF